MRILITTDTVGGVWAFTKTLATELLSLGHAVALISFGNIPSISQTRWCTQMSTIYENNFVYTPSMAPLEWMNANSLTYSNALPQLLGLMESFGPDLIHSNQFCYGYLPVDMPTVITAHSDVSSWAVACLPEGLEPSNWLDQYNFLVQRGLGAATFVTAPTEWMLARLRENFNFTMRSQVISNGCTLPQSSEAAVRFNRAVSAGRLWDKAKNVDLLSKVESRVSIFVAGSNSQEDAMTSNISSRLHLLGDLDEYTLLRLFRSSTIYIVPSCYEPFGLAPLEAALCGCAILANDIPSLREVWGQAALYFHNAEELTGLLDRLRESKNELFRARQKAFMRASTFTARNMTSAYLLLYEKSVAAHKHQPVHYVC